MPCEDKAERYGAGRSVDLRVLRVNQIMHKEIPTAFVCCDSMALTGYDRNIIASYLPVSLWMGCSRCYVFWTKMDTQGSNNLLTNCVPFCVRRYDSISY